MWTDEESEHLTANSGKPTFKGWLDKGEQQAALPELLTFSPARGEPT